MTTPDTFLAGERLKFAEVPPHLRLWVEDLVGGTLTSYRDVSGGMSTGFATVAEGPKRRVFVKGLLADSNPQAADAYREEAAGALLLPMHPSIPAFLQAKETTDDAGTWVANAFAGADGECPVHPWKGDDVVATLDAYADLAPLLQSWPWSRPDAHPPAEFFSCWQQIADSPEDPWHTHAERWTERTLAFAARTGGGRDAVLCHGDLRADNIVIGTSVSFVDWAQPRLAAPWFDPLLLMLDVAASGAAWATGGDVKVMELWKTHPLTREFDATLLIDGAAALAGALHRTASRPIEGLPHRTVWATAMAERLLEFAERHRGA